MLRLIKTSTYRALLRERAENRRLRALLLIARAGVDHIRDALQALEDDPIEGQHFLRAQTRADELVVTLGPVRGLADQTYVWPEGHPMRKYVSC